MIIVTSCLACTAFLPAGHQTSSCDSLHPANTSATDSDTEQSVIPNHLGNRAKPLETNDSDLSSPFNGSMAATRQTNSSRNSSRNNSDFAIDPVNSIERVMQSSVTDNDALPFLGFVVAVHRKMVSEFTSRKPVVLLWDERVRGLRWFLLGALSFSKKKPRSCYVCT